MNQGTVLSSYSPSALLDALQRHLQLDNDRALSRRLKVAGNVLAGLRRGSLPVGASMLLWMHEASGLSIDELRRLLGDRRAKFRPQACLARMPAPHACGRAV